MSLGLSGRINPKAIRDMADTVSKKDLNFNETIEVVFMLTVFATILEHPGPKTKEALEALEKQS